MIDILLRDKEVARMLGIGPASVWRMSARGDIPKPVKLGGSTRWRTSDITACIERLTTERDAEVAA